MPVDLPTKAKPIAFISSFYKEFDYPNYHDSPLWQLRQELAALNGDQRLRAELRLDNGRPITWVAEKSGEPLNDSDRFLVADRLVEVLRDSDLYVCILADHRIEKDHGSLIDFDGHPTVVSYFEIELYAAAMYGKRPILFALDGFRPGSRLQKLLEILSWAFPEWRNLRPQKPAEIIREIRDRIRNHLASPQSSSQPLRERIAEALYRKRARASLLFLDGASEKRTLPEKERVESLIQEYRRMPNYQRKLNRLWFAVRELMAVPYNEENAGSKTREFFPYWDCVLGDWAGAASWHGWHGHLYAGTIAPLNSQALIRSHGFARHNEFQPEVILPPDGALASAYFSLARILGGVYYWRCLLRAGHHVKRAMKIRQGPADNLLALRGSIYLRLGLWPCAVADFARMLQLRRQAAASAVKIADALMHLGEAYAVISVLPKGRQLLEEAVRILEAYPDNPNLPRARRKLAIAYRRARNFSAAAEMLQRAEADAARLAAFDQIRC